MFKITVLLSFMGALFWRNVSFEFAFALGLECASNRNAFASQRRQVCICVRNASGMRVRQKGAMYAFAFASEMRQKILIKRLRYF